MSADMLLLRGDPVSGAPALARRSFLRRLGWAGVAITGAPWVGPGQAADVKE